MLSQYTVPEEGVSGVVRTAAAVRYRLTLLLLPKQLLQDPAARQGSYLGSGAVSRLLVE